MKKENGSIKKKKTIDNKKKIKDVEDEVSRELEATDLGDEFENVESSLESSVKEEVEVFNDVANEDKLDDGEEDVVKKDIDNSLKKKGLYLDYNSRIITLSILFVVSLGLSVVFFAKTFKLVKEDDYTISGVGSYDYKVYLKDNEIYETPYLEKGMSYVADLIKNINVDFKYVFNSSKNIDTDLTFSVVGNLLIENEQNSKVYYTKEYELVPQQTVNLKDSNNYTIAKSIDIDYGYYNNIATNFKNTYAVSSKDKFVVTFKINQSSQDKTNSDSEEIKLVIPLSKKSVSIDIDGKDISNSYVVSPEGKIVLNNKLFLVLAIVLFGIALIIFFVTFKYLKYLFIKKSSYDSLVDKILKEYDRLIVETHTKLNFKEYNVFRVSKFEELLDARDNFKNPIMYYNVTSHLKCYFYLKNENDIYLLTIKAVDLDEKK